LSDKPNLLVAGTLPPGSQADLSHCANVISLDRLTEEELERCLPKIDAVVVQTWWPEALTPERIERMTKLRFVQSGMAGVNHIPFKNFGRRVIVSSNAGGFSTGVAEFALALMLAATKKVVKLDDDLRAGEFDESKLPSTYREVVILKGRTIGILGYGGIGKSVGSMARALGMNVIAFSRHSEARSGVRVYHGGQGLLSVLKKSDVVLISLPLSKLTVGLLGATELGAMKADAVLVNVARAEIVDEEAMYDHLVKNPRFTYATDVWRIERGKETYSSRFPVLKLPNFIGTPHVAGGSSAVTGDPGKAAVENLLRYLRGEAPHNVVDPSEYI
jgi:D-3-phosphoglycerate dehydrogenase